MTRLSLSFLTFLLFLAPAAQAADEEFRDMLRELNARYEDFFLRQKENEQWLREMRKGVGEHKAREAAEKKAYEQARLEQIRQRKAEPDTTPLLRQHEAEEKALAKQMEVERKIFVQRREQLRAIETGARRIPPEDELELYNE